MRLVSLDVFRGIAIATMVVVNMASVADPNVYPILNHAEWHGCTLADWVFPAFLFAVGLAMPFSLDKYTANHRPTAAVYGRIFRRGLILFGIGLLLNGFWSYDLAHLRWLGVLQRISLTYVLASLIALHLPRRGQWILTAVLLVGYWFCLTQVAVPEYGVGILTRAGNWGAWIDRLVIPSAHLYQGDGYQGLGDPEGLGSTIPAIASVMGGYFTGQWVRQNPLQPRTAVGLILAAVACVVAGCLWNQSFPVNKKLWTSSYVLLTTGWSLLVFAACYGAIELRQLRAWGKPFQVLGLNAIAMFVLSVLGIKLLVKVNLGTGKESVSLYDWIYHQGFVPWAGGEMGSLLFAILTLLFWWVVAYILDRKGWFFKV